ncbi:MAG: hypothetical protein UT50_C0017G0008 [Candidatus Moranbacteria bacterium GW2011_GWA2_39_41]|nr:MAG: hypothetical protein UT50_C0017G0008 [Candidatus Moranbacteria bacterium GW2011_GWA2_39_41]
MKSEEGYQYNLTIFEGFAAEIRNILAGKQYTSFYISDEIMTRPQRCDGSRILLWFCELKKYG